MYCNDNRFKGLSLTIFCILFSLTLLSACGDEKTPIREVSTSAAATGQAATGAATTGSAASTTAAVLGLEVSGASEVQIDKAFSAEVARLLAGPPNLTARLYVSGDSAEKLANSFDSAIIARGYSGLSGRPVKSNDAYVGIYTKAGSDDLIISTLDAPKDAGQLARGLNFQGLSESTVKNLYQQIAGKKTIALVFSGTNLVKAIFDAAQTGQVEPTATPGVAVTAPATPALATPAPVITADTAGPGSELVGTLLATADADIKVKKVERFDELSYEGKSVLPQGVFLVISYDFANVSKQPVALVSLALKDNQNREYEISTDASVSSALLEMNYTTSFVVNPGFIGSAYRVYDVPKTAAGFKLEPLFETDRQPSPASFTVNGGKGADSGAGQELVGKTRTLENEKADIKILSVERVNTIKDGGKSYKTAGAYLIVFYEFKNKGTTASPGAQFFLEDSESRIFSSTDNFDVIYATAKNSSGKYDASIKPGQTGITYRVFEVTREASGFTLADRF